MTEGRQPFTAEIKTLAKGPSTYDPLERLFCIRDPPTTPLCTFRGMLIACFRDAFNGARPVTRSASAGAKQARVPS
jgi:hypothetical protein